MTDEMGDYAWSLVADSGHLDCDGWQYDDETRRLTCACGVVLHEPPEAGIEQAILAAIKGRQTYALTGPSDAGQRAVDDFAQCKCPACVIARAAHVGFRECMRQRGAAYERLAAEIRKRDQAYFAAHFHFTDEVPF